LRVVSKSPRLVQVERKKRANISRPLAAVQFGLRTSLLVRLKLKRRPQIVRPREVRNGRPVLRAIKRVLFSRATLLLCWRPLFGSLLLPFAPRGQTDSLRAESGSSLHIELAEISKNQPPKLPAKDASFARPLPPTSDHHKLGLMSHFDAIKRHSKWAKCAGRTFASESCGQKDRQTGCCCLLLVAGCAQCRVPS